MICQFCHDEGKRSQVSQGLTFGTLMCSSPDYYDEDGEFVRGRDPNWYTTEYWCSNGHQFKVQRRAGDPDVVTLTATLTATTEIPQRITTVRRESGPTGDTYHFSYPAENPDA